MCETPPTMILHTHTSVILVGVRLLDSALPHTMTLGAYAPWPWEGHCQLAFHLSAPDRPNTRGSYTRGRLAVRSSTL